jgi:tetratricopeptide (TPR) repeat protein
MNGTRWMGSLAVLVGLSLFCLNASPLAAQEAAAGGAAQPKYTVAEYNAYIAAQNEKNPAAQIKALDDFVAKYPNSELLHFVYPLYYKNYYAQKNFQKAIEYADKEVALGDKAPAADKYDAYYVRAVAFNNLQNPDVATAKAEREAALAGLKSVAAVPKPDGVDDAKFAEQKKLSTIFFNGTAGSAGLAAKDCAGAAESYKAVLAITPDDLTSNYSLGKAYACMTPPRTVDALWSFARAATSKNANEAQSKQIKAYVRKLISNYQGNTVCDPLTDAELNELLQLAGSSADRPASYKLFGADELKTARDSMTIASVVTDLKAGGDKAKLTWAGACGLEFPEVPSKVMEVTPGDPADIKAAFVTSDAEFEAAKTPNMEFKVAGQPEAGKLDAKSDPPPFVHITGTLDSYDPDPAFMLHWSKGSVKADDLPKEKAAPKKPAPRKPAPKRP